MRTDLEQLTYALQLAALLPCAAIIVFLLGRRHNLKLSIVPSLYFVTLAGYFLQPLEVFGGVEISTASLILQNLIPGFTFLLLVQFLLGRVPPVGYWLVLCIPLVGGTPLLTLTFIGDDACYDETICLSTRTMLTLYRVLGGALVFLLLVAFLRRHPGLKSNTRQSQYWLIMAMIAFSLLLLGLDLVELISGFREDRLIFVRTMVGIGFVYVALSSIFRVFHPSYLKQLNKPVLTPLELDAVKKLLHSLEHEHLYRQSKLGRAELARHVKLPEHLLSRAVNLYCGKSVTELVTEWRLKEVKLKLESTDGSIADIAFGAGFASIASFNRVFKSETGMSATEFRRAARVAG